MRKTILVEKHSGEKEPFSPEKLHQSLERAGASQGLIEKVEADLLGKMFDGISTAEIYRRAFQLLRKYKNATAARYSLKNAIMDLGPTGYPFEQFVGELLRQMGYRVEVGQMVSGHCVQHEVDVVARNDHEQFMVECKFYNNQGKYCNVQVPLYIASRFRDIEQQWRLLPENRDMAFSGWVITNTRFTTDAMDYGKCVGLKLISWDYPRRKGLKEMIEQSGLFPVTALTTLNKKQKQLLLDEKVVLCRQLRKKPGLLDTIGLPRGKTGRVIEELDELIGD
jgi:hypothetical protein